MIRSFAQKTPSSKMDFYGFFASNEVVEAIGLGVDVSDIAVGQTTFGFEDVYTYICRKKRENSCLSGAQLGQVQLR
jgi:hypothetical protein